MFASGINLVDWDAVELPSQFMENWCLDEQTLFGMAKHYETGESLPVAEYQKLKDTETFLTAGGTRQAYLALTDLRLHYQYDPANETADELRRRVADEVLITPPIAEDRGLCAFGHIFAGGYSAGYYSYKWAEVLSADAFAFLRKWVWTTRKQSERPADASVRPFCLLVVVCPLAEAFARFRGRQPSTEALIRHSGLTLLTLSLTLVRI